MLHDVLVVSTSCEDHVSLGSGTGTQLQNFIGAGFAIKLRSGSKTHLPYQTAICYCPSSIQRFPVWTVTEDTSHIRVLNDDSSSEAAEVAEVAKVFPYYDII